ncbi:MAG: phosphoglycerate dehydrogenase [Wenzhouxiangella sp.]
MSNKSLSLAKEHIKFLMLEGVHARGLEELRRQGYSNIESLAQAPPPDVLAEKLRDAHFLGIRSRSQISAEVLAGAEKLTAIGCFCIGTDQVELSAARQRGIPVFNAPYANTRSVAELVLGEIIMLMRGIPARNMAAHRGEWLKSAKGSHEVRGKTLGIVGYGHIGSQLGILAEGLGMRVIYYDIAAKLPLGNAHSVGALDELLAQSEVVSLHVPDTDLTRNMINADTLSRMRPGVHFINAARGRIVDIPALAAALRQGHVASAALDVFPAEPKGADEAFVSELRGMDNVLLTPHIGGSTIEAQENIALDVATKLVRYSDNGSTMGAVNFPEVSLPDQAGTRRILHIHRNEPGVLQAINSLISARSINIAAQYLQTLPDVGYVVMDLETDDTPGLVRELDQIPATIRTRYLY